MNVGRITCVLMLIAAAVCDVTPTSRAAERPNILLAISDDQSYPYASAYGTSGVETPAFDRVARMGVLFRNGFAASPGCSPSRAALLTGRHDWRLEQAGTHASSFPKEYAVYPDLLAEAGYHVGHTGKGWGPGNFKESGWEHNPAGPAYQQRTMKSPQGIANTDYAANFKDFLDEKPDDAPFCFWYGAKEPHRAYKQGIGLESGKQLEDAFVPEFLPDTPQIRSDILDYCVEIEWFDQHLGRMLDLLEEHGELEHTLIVVTADNGMPFPRAKANCYEYGIHVPLAVCWPAKVAGGRTVDDLAGFVDLAPTFLQAAELDPRDSISGRSILPILTSDKSGTVDPEHNRAYAARERHSSSRYNNWTYPQRAMRTPEFLYIRNFRPDRWPAGDPETSDGKVGYHDIDASPSKSFLVEHSKSPEIARYYALAVGKRPAEELFDISKDPACLNDLAGQPEYADIRQRLSRDFEEYLRETDDPRVLDGGEVFETYKRYSPIRDFPPPEKQ